MRSGSDYQSQLMPLIRDTTGGTVSASDIIASLNRGIAYLQNKHGMYVSKQRADFELYRDVYEYALPSDFHDIINIQTPVTTPRQYTKVTSRQFWERFNTDNRIMAVDTQLGSRSLLFKDTSIGTAQLVHDCDSDTQNGTWAIDATTDATGLIADSSNYKQGSGSIRFDVDVSLNATDTATITNSTLTAVDLTNFSANSKAFAWVYIPTITDLTSLTLSWGTDSSNYYTASTTTQFGGAALRVGWNRVAFDWSSSTTTTGAPTISSIAYLSYTVTYASTFTDATGFRIDDIRFMTPFFVECHYYSSIFVTDGITGVKKAKFTQLEDLSLFADEDDDILLYYVLQDGYLIKEDYNGLTEARGRFAELLAQIKGRYQSERKREVTYYYA